MSQKLTTALLSIGEVKLQNLVGRNTIKLLALIDEKAINAANLISLLEKHYDNEILLDSKIREALLLSLSHNDAQHLLYNLVGKKSDNPWDLLLKISFSNRENLLIIYAFFALELPKPENESELPPSSLDITPLYPLFTYQKEVVRKTFDYITNHNRRVLIHMPTGAGKTRSAMALISKFLQQLADGKVVIWLAHSEELCEQAAQEFQKCWEVLGDRSVRLGRFYSKHELDLEKFNNGLIVAGLSKLYSRSSSQQSQFLKLKKHVSLVVMDEAHQAIAPTYEHLLGILAPDGGNTALVGLSATPGRSTLDIDEDEKLASFFNYTKVTLQVEGYNSPVQYLQDSGFLSMPEYIYLPYNPVLNLPVKELQHLADGFDLSLEILQKLGDNEQRNILIFEKVLYEVERNSKIIVFACSVEHAHLLADALTLKGVNAKALSTNTTALQRRKIIYEFKQTDRVQVLTNYGILTTGFDAPKTNVAIIARPTQSVVLYSQMIGRVMRGLKAGGNKFCRIYTVVDAIQGFRNIYEGFSHWEDVWKEKT